MPFFLEAAALSRMRSEVTFRSNWAKDNRTFNVSMPYRQVAAPANADIRIMPIIRGGSRPNGGSGNPVKPVRHVVRRKAAVQNGK
jgi:hypothetical protein